jgi:glycosyltransferase involved in cell wall biosynthesis
VRALHDLPQQGVLRLLGERRVGALFQYPPRPFAPSYREDPDLPASAPRISLVMPTKNQAAFIEQSLESIAAQAYPGVEVIVRDGGSSDGTVAILQRWSDRVHEWHSAPDGGQASALNDGFARCTGEIMGYLNSDDLLLPGALAAVARYFVLHPECDVVYGHRVIIDDAGREVGRWILPPHDDEALGWADYVPQETLFWRRRIWEKAGARIADLHFAMDWELLLRFREAGARMVRLPRFLGAFRVHHAQKTIAAQALGLSEIERLRAQQGRRLGHARKRAQVHVLKSWAWHRLYQWKLLRYTGA